MAQNTRINAKILAGLKGEDKDNFLKSFSSSKDVREILAKHLTNRLESVIIESESIKIYDSPNALSLLADLQGYRRALRETIKLILPEEQSE